MKRMYNTRRWSKRKPALFPPLVLLILFSTSPAVFGQDALECDDAIESAESTYTAGEFLRSIQLLEFCLQVEAFSLEEQRDAYQLLAKARQRRGENDEARHALVELLQLHPRFTADPVQDTPAFRDLLEEVRRDMGLATLESRIVELDHFGDRIDLVEALEDTTAATPDDSRSRWRTWLVIGGGAAVTGLAAVLTMGSRGERGSGWPPPPARPGE